MARKDFSLVEYEDIVKEGEESDLMKESLEPSVSSLCRAVGGM